MASGSPGFRQIGAGLLCVPRTRVQALHPGVPAPCNMQGPVSHPDATRLAPGDVVDDFEIQAVLADGGTSTTYQAVSRSLGRAVELKVFRPATFSGGTEAGVLAQARRDASGVARLEHPGISPVFGAGEHEGGLFLASAPPSGQTLSELGVAGSITPALASEWIAALAVALEHAHAHGVLHRDLRPDCVTVGRWGNPMLRDFGVTRTSGRTGLLTRAEVMDSLRYTAPEIVLGRPATAATDTYGLAALAVWCLTGAPPYRDRPAAAYVLFRASAPPPELAFADGAPAHELSSALRAAMAVEPGDRPTPRAFAASLAHAVGALPQAVREAAAPFVALEAAEAEPAPEVVSPRAGDMTRVEHRRPVAVEAAAAKRKISWTTYASCVLIALIVGSAAVAIGRFTAPGPPPPVRVGDFALNPDPAWRLVLRGAEVQLVGRPGEAAVLGIAKGRLPSNPVDVSGLAKPAPRPRVVRSGKTGLVRYKGGDEIVLARPTTGGALYARCPQTTDERRCAALVVAARGGGRPLSPAPLPAVADALRESLLAVQKTSAIALSEMSGGAKTRAAAADRLALALREATAPLAVEGVDPETAASLKAVSKALAGEGAAFEDLSSAVDRRSAVAEAVARKAALAADGRLRTALGRLSRAGYPIDG